jgi:hypothetical protein
MENTYFIMEIHEERWCTMEMDSSDRWYRKGKIHNGRVINIHSIYISKAKAKKVLAGLSTIEHRLHCDKKPENPLYSYMSRRFYLRKLSSGGINDIKKLFKEDII